MEAEVHAAKNVELQALVDNAESVQSALQMKCLEHKQLAEQYEQRLSSMEMEHTSVSENWSMQFADMEAQLNAHKQRESDTDKKWNTVSEENIVNGNRCQELEVRRVCFLSTALAESNEKIV